MSSDVALKSFEDELKPMLVKPKDSEFKRELHLSLDAKTAETELEDITKQIWELTRDVWTNHRMAHTIQTLKYTSLLLSALALPASITWTPSVYGAIVPLVSEVLKSDSFRTRLMYQFLEKKKEERKFGISLTGISVKGKELSIDPKELEPNVFYLFSYLDDRYVARKVDEDIVEIYEVLE